MPTTVVRGYKATVPMRLGRPLPPIVLTTDERATFDGWARRRPTTQAWALQARIVLDAAAGESNTRIARRERVTKETVVSDASAS